VPGTPATAAQKKKLNVLVGRLRPDHISTDQLYSAVARMRDVDPQLLRTLGYDDTLTLRWSLLRERLTKGEAHDLIERLERLEENSAGESSQPDPPGDSEATASPAESSPAEQEQGSFYEQAASRAQQAGRGGRRRKETAE
jgi:hypothetical protein